MHFNSQRRSAFTLMELMLALGILGVIVSIAIIALNPGKQLAYAENAKRKAAIRTLDNAFLQYTVDQGTVPVTGIPSGEPQAMPICRNGVTDPSCVDLSVLVPTYIADLPVDSKETSTTVTGYEVYVTPTGVKTCGFYLPTDDEKRCSNSTYTPDTGEGTTEGGTTGGTDGGATGGTTGGTTGATTGGSPPPVACNGSPFTGGAGVYGNPYQICSCEGLQAITGSNHYVLTEDIDCSATITWNGGAGFTTIPTFSGTLDGQNHTVTGLTIYKPMHQGLGIVTFFTGTIKNLKLRDIAYTGMMYVGGIAATSFTGIITNVSVTGTITTNMGAYVGGLVGLAQQATSIGRTWADVNINSTVTPGNLGGVGGLIGTVASSTIVVNSYALGDVNVTGASAGGFMGSLQNAWILKSFSTGHVTGNTLNTSGFGMVESGTSQGNFYDTNTSGMTDSVSAAPKTTAQMRQQATFTPFWDFVNTWQINEGISYPTLQTTLSP